MTKKTSIALLSGLAALALFFGLAADELRETQWRKTYCAECGVVRDIHIERYLFGLFEQKETKELRRSAAQPIVGKHQHDWVQPSVLAIPDQELEPSSERSLRVQTKVTNLLGFVDEPSGPDLSGLRELGPERAKQVLRQVFDPELFLPVLALDLFMLDVAPESRWALWQQYVSQYECQPGVPIRCGLTKPTWIQLREVGVHSRAQNLPNWRDWTFGRPAPPSLFGVDSYAPKSESDGQRARSAAQHAYDWLIVEKKRLAPTVHVVSEGKARTREGLEAWVMDLHGSPEQGRLEFRVQLGDDEYLVDYHHGGASFREENGAREELSPRLQHGMERSMRHVSLAHFLRFALDDPKSKWRSLPHDVEGESVILVNVAGRFPTRWTVADDGTVISEAAWHRTPFGMDLVTTEYDTFRQVEGQRVRDRQSIRRGGSKQGYMTSRLKGIEFPAAPPLPKAVQKNVTVQKEESGQ